MNRKLKTTFITQLFSPNSRAESEGSMNQHSWKALRDDLCGLLSEKYVSIISKTQCCKGAWSAANLSLGTQR